MSSKYKLCVYIGRFSPFHNGHAEVLKRAAKRHDHVLVLIGSVFKARNPKNPWRGEERAGVINAWAKNNGLSNISIDQARDFPYNDTLWIANIQRLVRACLTERVNVPSEDVEISLTGADRDESTFYLKFFLEFKMDLAEEDRAVSKLLTATSIRNLYFGREFDSHSITAAKVELLLKAFLPCETVDYLREFEKTEHYDNMVLEHEFNISYKKQFAGLKYEPIHHTADALVVQTGYILLVKRRSQPGKGLWAMPGGFVNPNERLVDSMLRELEEETKLKVAPGIIRSSIKFHDNFDYPGRSLRGRVITTAYLIKLPDFVVDGKISLPKIKGSDDAEKASWVPIDTVMKSSELMFEDHYEIIESLLAQLKKDD